VASFKPRPFYPLERDLVLIVQEARWAPGRFRWAWDISPPLGFDALPVQPIMSR